MNDTTVDLRGWLVFGSNGEEDSILCLVPPPHINPYWGDMFLAENIAALISMHGRYLSVRYWTAETEHTKAELEEQTVLQVMGRGEADYEMHYSDITGYLWTDEELRVGGHDLLEELKGSAGKFCHLEITFSKVGS